jgi:SAM-dependent methyltransferase
MSTLFSRWRAWWDALHDEQSEALERLPSAWTRPAVVVASALTLYVEMVLVRWHGTCFHAFAIFKNVSLLSCFLGLGIGYGLSGRRRSTLAAFLPLLALQALLFGLLSLTNLGGRRINPVAEQLVMGTSSDHHRWLDLVEGNGFLAAVFVINALMFIPLGHLAGRLLSRLPKVEGYSLNLLGSLAGIAVFFGLSLLWTPPAVWMGVAVLGVAPFLAGHRRLAAVAGASLAVILVALGLMERAGEQTFYSPYQVITLQLPNAHARAVVPTIKVNHAFFQDVVDCSGRPGGADPITVAYYNLPYQLQSRPGDVLVVGAGSGNDVAAALRHGADSVTAVEIDPAVLYLGERIHPERPYQDPRTRSVLNDARSFLRQTDQRFDTIVYGLLDSHTNLGTMTNVRLDSFVYTVEGFREAAARLKPGGLLVVSYLVLDPRQGDKLYAMLRDACPGREPRAFRTERGVTFVTGPGLDRVPAEVAGAEEQTADFRRSAANADVATDDWPFFYMQQRTYPVTYAVMILFLLGLSVGIVRAHLGRSPLAFRAYPSGAAAFFFLGAGFMLIETKGVTELGLAFGNTWSVLAVVVSGILVMVYLANQWVLRRGPVRHGWSFALLGAALLLGWGVTRLGPAGVAVPLPRLVLPVVLTLPLFFAGLVFSSELARRGELGAALSANLFGAMLGGFLEYNSMYWGFGSLYPLGMALYGLAFVCVCWAGRRGADESAAPVEVRSWVVSVEEGGSGRVELPAEKTTPCT